MKYLTFVLNILVFQTTLAQSILGIDVSHHQGSINWTMVANDGKVFAFYALTLDTGKDTNIKLFNFFY